MRINENNTGHIRAAMVGALSLGGLSGLMATGVLGPFRVAFIAHYGITQRQLGGAFFVIFIVLGIIGIWHGPKLADRIGRYRLLKYTVGAMVIGLIGCGLSTGLYALAGFWALFMLGAYLSIIVNAVVTDLWRDRPRRGVILLHSTLSVGKIIGPSVATACMVAAAWMPLSSLSPWRIFFFIGAACAFTILVFLWFVPQGKVYHPREEHAWEEDPLDKRLLLWLAAALLGLIAGSENALAGIAPAFFEKQHGLSDKFAASLVTFHFIAVAMGRFAFGIFGGKLTSKATVTLAAIPAALIIPVAYASSQPVAIVCFVLVGLCFSATWPSIFAHVAGMFSQNRSRLTLAVGLMNAAGIAVGTLATSWFLDSNPPMAMLLGPVMLVLCAAAFILFQNSLAKQAQRIE